MSYSIKKNEDSPCVFRGVNAEKLTVVWEITAACNLKCPYCFRTDPSIPGLDDLEIIGIANQIDQEVVGKVLITGGEPVLYNKIKDVIDVIADKGILVKLVSNLSFPEKYLAKFSNQRLLEFSTSIDGYNEKTHDSIRGKGSFKRISKNVSFLLNSGYSVSGISVVTKEVLPNIKDIIKTAISLGLSTITFSRLINIESNTALNITDVFNSSKITQEEEKLFLKDLTMLKNQYGSITIRSVGFTKSSTPCTKAGSKLVYIDPNGVIQPCTLYRFLNKRVSLKEYTLPDALLKVKDIGGEYCESYCRSLPVINKN